MKLPQHAPASAPSQRSPGGVHPGIKHRPLRHSNPEQHPSFDVQGSVSLPHAQVPAVDPIGRLHLAPPQQSRSEVQVDSRAWQRQVPCVQSIDPQHSRLTVQRPIAGRQQKLPPGCAPHA